ncbi:MAG: hypothetical protein N2595_03145, partial [bacterium]|nr:hypothetical protein [bacterium]
AGDDAGLREALGVDFVGVTPPYIVPKRHADIPERGVMVNEWGIHMRWIEHASGGCCDFSLQNATEEEVAAWPMPTADECDYGWVTAQCAAHQDKALYVGHAGIADVINTNGMLRGMEQTLVDLITDDPAGLLLARRRVDVQVGMLERAIEAAKGQLTFVWMGEDLGTQIAPIVAMDLYRRNIKRLHERIVAVAKAYDVPVMIHTCGSSSWAYEEFIGMGIRAVDTLQPEAVNMASEYLKRTFGRRLVFHGCISTAGPVATGTVEEARAYCERTLEIMMPGGGYCFAPRHCLQDNTPTENVVAMYEVAREKGRY